MKTKTRRKALYPGTQWNAGFVLLNSDFFVHTIFVPTMFDASDISVGLRHPKNLNIFVNFTNKISLKNMFLSFHFYSPQ
jgi:hypothetical protein